MRIREIKLRNFRNYETCSLELYKGVNLFTGNNAQGKTNLLESLVYLSLTRSFRINDDKKLIRNGCPFADIRCICEKKGKKKELEAVIHHKGKTLLCDKVPMQKSSEFVGILNVILFSPDDIILFQDSPSERRKVMDQEISKISIKYLEAMNQYRKLLKQRNLVLKKKEPDRIFLETLTKQMSVLEAKIIANRIDFCKVINDNIDFYYQKIADDPSVHLTVAYKTCFKEFGEKQIMDQHLSLLEKDIEQRVTSIGVHREDICFFLNGKNIIETASQGQKRMAMLAFKLSLNAYIRNKTNEDAVLLLDDVLSELDNDKQKRLLALVSNSSQCLITATHIPEMMKNERMREFHVVNGTIRQEDLNERNG